MRPGLTARGLYVVLVTLAWAACTPGTPTPNVEATAHNRAGRKRLVLRARE